MNCVLGLALAVNQKQLVIFVVRNHLIQAGENLFILLALLSKGVAVRVLQVADGDVVHLLLVENSEGKRLTGALGRAVSDEEGTVLLDSH